MAVTANEIAAALGVTVQDLQQAFTFAQRTKTKDYINVQLLPLLRGRSAAIVAPLDEAVQAAQDARDAVASRHEGLFTALMEIATTLSRGGDAELDMAGIQAAHPDLFPAEGG